MNPPPASAPAPAPTPAATPTLPVPVPGLAPRSASPPSSSPPSSSPPPASSPSHARRGPPRPTRAQLFPPTPNSCVVLKNLDYKITQDELVEIVRNVAGGRKEFDSVSLIADKATGSFRGMAFVNFHTVDDAASALQEMSKMVINGRRVVAEYRRLRPGEREKREAAAERRRMLAVHAPRATFEQNVTDVDADGNAMDKRRAFFHTREVVRKADEKSRAAEKADRDRERETLFRARLADYHSLPAGDPDSIEDISFESDLTSYERRMVHVICDEMGLGHMSVLGDDGIRVLKVTRHPQRMAEWAELTADIRAAANERKGGADAEEKKRRKEARREASRIASSPNGHASSEWKKAGATDNSTQGGPVTKEELEGIKWFKPRSAKAAAGEELNASNAIKLPQYKLYIPPRQPSGPDGTIGFHKRKPPAPKAADAEGDDAPADEHVQHKTNGDANNDSGSPQQSPVSTESGAEQPPAPEKSLGNAEESLKSPSTSQTLLNPSVPAFTPSAAYAS